MHIAVAAGGLQLAGPASALLAVGCPAGGRGLLAAVLLQAAAGRANAFAHKAFQLAAA